MDLFDILLMLLMAVGGYVWGRADERAYHMKRMAKIIREQRRCSY